jgi:GMP synthase (glutamine-hydrolysing)
MRVPLRAFQGRSPELGRNLGRPNDLVMRHSWHCYSSLGEATPEQVAIARKADYIFIEEIKAAGIYGRISQVYAA